MAPHASECKDGQYKASSRKGASIGNKPSYGFPKELIEVKAPCTEANCHFKVSGSKNSKSNTTPASHAKSSRLSEGPASEISQDDSVEDESPTRVPTPRAATRLPIPPPIHSNERGYVESPQLTKFTENSPGAQHLHVRELDLDGTHNLTPSGQPENRVHDSYQSVTPSVDPQPLSATVMASLAAEKAKIAAEELAAKRQYINEHDSSGWDIEDYKEVGIRGGCLEKGVVTPTSSPASSSQSRTDSESTASGDSPVEATGPTMAHTSRPAEAAYSSAHSSLASQPLSECGDTPVDLDDSAMSAAAESVISRGPCSLSTAGSSGNGKGKAVAMDQDEEESSQESSDESTKDPNEVPTSGDHIVYQYRGSTHTNGRSTMASSSHGPIEREAKKMPPGHVATGEETHSRAQILVGTPQPDALIIKIQTEKRDKHDVVTSRALVTHKYTKGINWADARDVKRLNKWRSQILVRAFKAKHERRWKYTLKEMNMLCHFLEKELAAPGVDGLMANVDWALVTNNFNKFFQGTTQHAGELYASASYTGDDGKKISAAGRPMKDDRDAPFRSEIALKNQIYHFTDQRAVDLIRNSRGVRPWDLSQEPAGDEPQEDAENVSPVLPSDRSSPSSNEQLKKLIIKLGDGSKVTLENKKRANTEDQTDEEMYPPNKKTKMSEPSHLRGGSGDFREDSESNFDYSEDGAPPTHYQGRELHSDSPFIQGSSSRTAQAFTNAQRVLGQGGRADDVNNRLMMAQSTSSSRSRPASREIEENYDDDSDDEETLPSNKANVNRRLPQEAQLPPVNPQARHPLPALHSSADAQGSHRRIFRRPSNIAAPQRRLIPNGPLLSAQHGLPQTAPSSNIKKRARDDGTADMGNNNQQVQSKRTKLQDQHRDQHQHQRWEQYQHQQGSTVRAPNQIFLAPYPHNSSVANREAALRLQLRAPVRGPQIVTRTLGQTGPRLPTLDDYFAEE
ncbi:hypothetical protein EAE96_011092 [Botrytis aclada]|nr:hypothetical protein EAE96_011092 [Botrytis aclada]